MKIESIKKLARQGESHILEFKKSTAQLKAIGEALCAFLNGDGGVILIGITDEGKIIGQHVTDNTRQEIAKMLRLLEPFPSVIVNYISMPDNDKYVIAISTNKHNGSIPYVFDGCAYQRNQSTTSKMPQELYQNLLIERLNDPKHWEKEAAKNIKLDDLDENEILKTIQEGILNGRIEAKHLTNDYKKALISLKLLYGDLPTNAAVVLFAKDVLPDYSQCLIRLARFKGTTKSEFIDNQQIFGNFFHLLNVAMDFVQRHMPIAGKIELGKIARTDTPLIPIRAIREALINALCHRDYTLLNRSISLGIYDDRLEITSPGKLPRSITIEKLKTIHDSSPRNKAIANVLFRRGIIEQWGSGTSEMIELCRDAHQSEPEFIEDDNMFIVRFKAQFSVGVISADDMAEGLTDRQSEILTILQLGKPFSVKDIASKMSDPPANVTIRKYLLKLKKLNLVTSIGRAKTAKWKILSYL